MDSLTTIDDLARRFHELYFGHLFDERRQWILGSGHMPTYDEMPQHQEALRAALFQLENEGLIEFADTD